METNKKTEKRKDNWERKWAIKRERKWERRQERKWERDRETLTN